jgi:hypothetical protein
VIVVIAVAVVVIYVVYEAYENNKQLEAGRIKKTTENTPLEKYGVKSISMVDNQTCKVERIIVPIGDDKGTHYTFFKEGNQWYYHPPGEPHNWIPCTNEEAKYLEDLVKEAEEDYARTKGICMGESEFPPIPPIPLSVGGRKRRVC